VERLEEKKRGPRGRIREYKRGKGHFSKKPIPSLSEGKKKNGFIKRGREGGGGSNRVRSHLRLGRKQKKKRRDVHARTRIRSHGYEVTAGRGWVEEKINRQR